MKVMENTALQMYLVANRSIKSYKKESKGCTSNATDY